MNSGPEKNRKDQSYHCPYSQGSSVMFAKLATLTTNSPP